LGGYVAHEVDAGLVAMMTSSDCWHWAARWRMEWTPAS